LGTMFLILGIILTIILPFYIIYKPPGLLIHYFRWRWPDVLWQVDTPQRIVALTIDDAPSQHTREIMHLLKESGATATFFVIGAQVHSHEDEAILQDLVLHGNELGNHAMHDEPSRSLTDAELRHQIEHVDDLIVAAYSAAGVQREARYFRPGSGFFSTRMRSLVAAMQYKLVLGGIYPHDPQIPYWSVNARHILSMLRPGGIIICHDRRSWTVPMLKRVLAEGGRRGYRFVTVSELLKEAEV